MAIIEYSRLVDSIVIGQFLPCQTTFINLYTTYKDNITWTYAGLKFRYGETIAPCPAVTEKSSIAF